MSDLKDVMMHKEICDRLDRMCALLDQLVRLTVGARNVRSLGGSEKPVDPGNSL